MPHFVTHLLRNRRDEEAKDLRRATDQLLGSHKWDAETDSQSPLDLAAMTTVLGAESPPESLIQAVFQDAGLPTLPVTQAVPGKFVGDRVAVPGYEILEELGRGAMGVVYRARHLRLNRLVALKMILAGEHAGPEERARFRSEAEAAARLQHPNIVQIHEVDEHNGRPYIALEFVEGGSLDGKDIPMPMPERQAAQLLETLARAMIAAHQRGIVHRDLKPANVLLASDGTPKITDFGLAKLLDGESGHTQTGSILGTPSYMAPEQAAGKTHEIGPAADLYALGAILYELLTGRPPFRAATPMATLHQVLTLMPVPPRHLLPELSRDLETICLKCLEKEPHKRYSNAEALAEDLRRFLAGQPVRARPVGEAERLWRWGRRNPMVASLLAMLIADLTGGLTAVSWQWRRTEVARHSLTRVIHAQEVIETLEMTISGLKDAETGQRGYLLTADERYLEPYQTALVQFDHRIGRLRTLTENDTDAQRRLDVVKSLGEAKLQEIQTTIDLGREHGIEAALSVVLTHKGKESMDQVRGLIAQMEQEEREKIRSLTDL